MLEHAAYVTVRSYHQVAVVVISPLISIVFVWKFKKTYTILANLIKAQKKSSDCHFANPQLFIIFEILSFVHIISHINTNFFARTFVSGVF